MSVWALGLNHHSAPLDIRGRFAFALEHMAPALHGLRQNIPHQPEAAIVSTCNRTEVYCAGSRVEIDHTLHWLAQAGGVPAKTLRSYTYVLQDDTAARHAFRVASGLDSMVLGEPQILGQMKHAARAAQQAGSLGRTLNQMFQRSFAVAKQVRNSTAIGLHSISMAAAAVRLAKQVFNGDLKPIRILFIGAGEMVELAATHFAAQNPLQITIANRTMQRGEALAARCAGSVMPLASIPERLHEFDAVVSCTASTLPIIGLGAVERALKKRHYRPIFMVDLAVPRDIEPEVQALPDVHLYTVDDLTHVVQTGHAQRQAAVAQAEAIVEQGVHHFMHWLHQRDPATGVVPLIQQIQQQASQWRQAEIARARKHIARGANTDEVLEQLTQRLSNKLLHGALVQLHNANASEQAHVAELVQRVFLRNQK